nr:MAG TPA: hypothetical protein [Caudoviricetes sp.]
MSFPCKNDAFFVNFCARLASHFVIFHRKRCFLRIFAEILYIRVALVSV